MRNLPERSEHMRYIVLDLEWNQPKHPKEAIPCGNNRKLEGEVVQVGVVVLDDEKTIRQELRILIRPRFYTRMSRRISDLTGITDDMLATGVPIEDAMQTLRELTCADEPFAFFSWGMDDLRVLKQNFAMVEMDDTWLTPWYNLQMIFGLQTGAGKAQKALKTAMETLELEIDRPAHDALNDAYFAALVMQKLDMEKGLAEYPSDGRRKKTGPTNRRRHRGRGTKGPVSVPVKTPKAVQK